MVKPLGLYKCNSNNLLNNSNITLDGLLKTFIYIIWFESWRVINVTYTSSWLVSEGGLPLLSFNQAQVFSILWAKIFLSPTFLFSYSSPHLAFLTSPSEPSQLRVICTSFPSSSLPTHSSAHCNPRLVSTTILGGSSKDHCNLLVPKCSEYFSVLLLLDFSILLDIIDYSCLLTPNSSLGFWNLTVFCFSPTFQQSLHGLFSDSCSSAFP